MKITTEAAIIRAYHERNSTMYALDGNNVQVQQLTEKLLSDPFMRDIMRWEKSQNTETRYEPCLLKNNGASTGVFAYWDTLGIEKVTEELGGCVESCVEALTKGEYPDGEYPRITVNAEVKANCMMVIMQTVRDIDEIEAFSPDKHSAKGLTLSGLISIAK